MKTVKKALLAMAAFGALGIASATPAAAAVIINFNNVNTDENVLFAASTNVAAQNLIAATNQTQTPVTFFNTLGLFANASGQSSTTSSSDGLFGITRVTIASGSVFTTASFNLDGIPGNPPPAEASNVFVEALGLGGSVIGSANLLLAGNGENRIGIRGDMNEVFTGFRVTLTPTGAGVDSLSQVRLGGISRQVGAVPEPAAWMLMLIGMGGIGYSMRRKNKPTLRVRYT